MLANCHAKQAYVYGFETADGTRWYYLSKEVREVAADRVRGSSYWGAIRRWFKVTHDTLPPIERPLLADSLQRLKSDTPRWVRYQRERRRAYDYSRSERRLRLKRENYHRKKPERVPGYRADGGIDRRTKPGKGAAVKVSINYNDPCIRTVYGFPPPDRIWYALERISGGIDVFSSEEGRAAYMDELRRKGLGDTVRGEYEVRIGSKSYPRPVAREREGHEGEEEEACTQAAMVEGEEGRTHQND